MHSIRDLYEAALALPPAERAAWLVRRCEDEALRRRILAMVEATTTSDPLARPLDERADALVGSDEAAPALPSGGRIGPFELVGVLGQGGFSTVYRGVRDVEGVAQEVAIKLLHHGLHTAASQRQFRREQRALAQLRHPNIARLIEGGVTDAGLPYIALELVEGERITEHARRLQLGLRARLELFLVVCAAVEAAHRALIVHRDLKPANVLVTGEGHVKLLDFGIAKLLDDVDTDDATRTGHQPFTPAYAAPEQRAGTPVTTATDVYALGVLLGELVSGQRLNDGKGATPASYISGAEAAGVLPEPAALMRRRLRGDLGAIVQKALADEPERRYASAAGLADDVRRLLEERPVLAQKPTRWYRASRFVQRHRGGMAMAAAFLLALLAAFAAVVWQARIAAHEARRANAEARQAEAVRDFLVSLFEAAQPDVPRDKRPGIEDLVEEAIARVVQDNALAPATRAELLLTLAHVASSIGAAQDATQLLDRLELELASAEAGDTRLRAALLRAEVLIAQARPAEAGRLLERYRPGFEQRADGLDVRGTLLLANARAAEHRLDEALLLFEQARRQAMVADTGNAVGRTRQMEVDVAHAQALMNAHRFREGLTLADATWDQWRTSGAVPDRSLTGLMQSIATAAEATGDMQRAERAYRDAIDLSERLHARPHADTAWMIGLYGSFLVARARYEEAEPHVQRALDMRRSLLGDAHPDTLNGMAAMGRLRAGQRRDNEALDWFAQGVAVCRQADVRHSVCPRLMGSQAQMLSGAGQLEQAVRLAGQAVEHQRLLTGEGSPQVGAALGFLARVQVKAGQYAEAVHTTDEILQLLGPDGGMRMDVRYARFQRAQALFGLDRHDEALALVKEVVAEQKRHSPDERSTLFSMLTLQARAFSRTGRVDEARASAREALGLEGRPAVIPPQVQAGLERLAAGGRGY